MSARDRSKPRQSEPSWLPRGLKLGILLVAAGALVLTYYSGHTGLESLPVFLKQQGLSVPLRNDLGHMHVVIQTRSLLAQRYFDQGMRLIVAFNFPEAVASFRAAQQHDADCAMCAWGEAFALGRNLNDDMNASLAPHVSVLAIRATAMAQSRPCYIQGNPPCVKEFELISVLHTRLAPTETEYTTNITHLCEAYAQAMTALHARYPTDHTIAMLAADAVMNLRPWDYWDPQTRAIRPEIAPAVAMLEEVLAADPQHAGAIHLYIHVTEGSDHPETAVPFAERLAALMPGATHIVHMPSHTFIRTGLYNQASAANRAAVGLPPPDEVYPLHNLEFLAYTLRMEGRGREAMSVGERLYIEAKIRLDGGMDCCEAGSPMERFLATHLYALVVFQQWASILALPTPHSEHHFYTSWYHWARGMAHCKQGHLILARGALADLVSAQARTVAAGARYRAPIFPSAILTTMAAMQLQAALVSVEQSNEEIALLSNISATEATMRYDEPPTLFAPSEHALTAALLRRAQPAHALLVAQNCLTRFLNDPWCLYAAMKAHTALGHTKEAAALQAQFDDAWSQADSIIEDPLFAALSGS